MSATTATHTHFLTRCRGWLADTKLGRYKVISIGVAVCGLAHLILVVGALPKVLQAGRGMAPFVLGLVILAVGAGKCSCG